MVGPLYILKAQLFIFYTFYWQILIINIYYYTYINKYIRLYVNKYSRDCNFTPVKTIQENQVMHMQWHLEVNAFLTD